MGPNPAGLLSGFPVRVTRKMRADGPPRNPCSMLRLIRVKGKEGTRRPTAEIPDHGNGFPQVHPPAAKGKPNRHPEKGSNPNSSSIRSSSRSYNHSNRNNSSRNNSSNNHSSNNRNSNNRSSSNSNPNSSSNSNRSSSKNSSNHPSNASKTVTKDPIIQRLPPDKAKRTRSRQTMTATS